MLVWRCVAVLPDLHMLAHTTQNTLPFLVYSFLFQLSIHFKLLLTAARFVILPFLFYFFIFMCNVTRTTQNTPIYCLLLPFTFNTFLSCCWLRLGLLFYLFYFYYVQCHFNSVQCGFMYLLAFSKARCNTQFGFLVCSDATCVVSFTPVVW